MKTCIVRLLPYAAIAAGSLIPLVARGRPHATPSSATRTVTTTTPVSITETGPAEGIQPLAWWLGQPTCGPNSVVLPLGQLVQSATSAVVVPLDRKNPKEIEIIRTVSTALDTILLKMNQPDSPSHVAVDSGQQAVAFRAALLEKLTANKDGSADPPPTGGNASKDDYPAFTLPVAGTNRTACFGVTIFSTDHAAATRELRVYPANLGALKLGESTSCLCIAIETNGKTGRAAAFLNWELLDIAKLPVRATVSFEGKQDAIQETGARLDDGRKGRD